MGDVFGKAAVLNKLLGTEDKEAQQECLRQIVLLEPDASRCQWGI